MHKHKLDKIKLAAEQLLRCLQLEHGKSEDNLRGHEGNIYLTLNADTRTASSALDMGT